MRVAVHERLELGEHVGERNRAEAAVHVTEVDRSLGGLGRDGLLELLGTGDGFRRELRDLVGAVDRGLRGDVGDDDLGTADLNARRRPVVGLDKQRPHPVLELRRNAGELLGEEPAGGRRRRHGVVGAGQRDLVEAPVAHVGGAIALELPARPRT